MSFVVCIAKISMTSPINVPTRALLAGETKGSFVQWLANLNVKRNLTSMFVNKYLPYFSPQALEASCQNKRGHFVIFIDFNTHLTVCISHAVITYFHVLPSSPITTENKTFFFLSSTKGGSITLKSEGLKVRKIAQKSF